MYAQNYCMIDAQTNICYNITLWDGDPETWTLPANTLMLVQADTPSRVWVWDEAINDWVLTDMMGQGQIGFIWDGMYLIVPGPKPALPKSIVEVQ